MTEEPHDRDLETVATFIDLTRAQSARSVLEAAGIECFLRDENIGNLHWGTMPALGGLRLQVPKDRAADAREALFGSGAELAGEPSDPFEAAALERSRRIKRWVGWVTLLIILAPCLLGGIVALLP